MPQKKPKAARRRSGPALFQKKPGGQFFLRWSATDPVTGKRGSRTKATGCYTYADAERFREQVAGELEAGRGLPKPPTLGKAAEEWLEVKERSGIRRATCAGYRKTMRRLVEALGEGAVLANLRPADFRRFLRHLEEHYKASPTALKKELVPVRMFLNWCALSDYVRRNYAAGLSSEVRAPRPKRIGAWSVGLYQELHAALEERAASAAPGLAARNAAAIRDWIDLLWWSGLRSIEWVRMTWEDVDLFSGRAVVRSPENKGGVRSILLHPAAREILVRRAARREEMPEPDLVLGLTRNILQKVWARFRREEERFAAVKLHGARYALATRLKEKGYHAAAQELLGHADPMMTEHYTTPSEEYLREALDAL